MRRVACGDGPGFGPVTTGGEADRGRHRCRLSRRDRICCLRHDPPPCRGLSCARSTSRRWRCSSSIERYRRRFLVRSNRRADRRRAPSGDVRFRRTGQADRHQGSRSGRPRAGLAVDRHGDRPRPPDVIGPVRFGRRPPRPHDRAVPHRPEVRRAGAVGDARDLHFDVGSGGDHGRDLLGFSSFETGGRLIVPRWASGELPHVDC